MQNKRKLATPQAVKTRAPALAHDVSAIAAFKTIAATLLTQIQANRQGVIEGRDPEYLHQMRVAVRRLRSLCGDYKKVLPKAVLHSFVADLRWLGRAMGPARDTDVFVTEIWPRLRAALNEDPLLAYLDAQWASQRQASAAKVRRALAARRYRRFMLGFKQQLGDVWYADASVRHQSAQAWPHTQTIRRHTTARTAY